MKQNSSSQASDVTLDQAKQRVKGIIKLLFSTCVLVTVLIALIVISACKQEKKSTEWQI